MDGIWLTVQMEGHDTLCSRHLFRRVSVEYPNCETGSLYLVSGP